MKQPYVELLGLLLCAVPAAALAQESPVPSSDTVQSLHAMDNSYTEGHPDVINEFAGMHLYAEGDYQGAMKDFLVAASYADKPSQLSIGLMYLNGQGVQKDPMTAYAWIALAAERGYPQFESTREEVWRQLNSSQREQAKVMQQQLSGEYGDAVAQPRMLQALQQSIASGSASNGAAQSAPTDCAKIHAVECKDVYASWFWDPNKYFAGRDAAWNRVVVPPAFQYSDRNKVNGGVATAQQP